MMLSPASRCLSKTHFFFSGRKRMVFEIQRKRGHRRRIVGTSCASLVSPFGDLSSAPLCLLSPKPGSRLWGPLSSPLHFRLTAKIRCAPLLLLSQMDPLRWAPFGSPGIGPATAIRGRNRERSWSYLSAAWFVDQAGRGAVPVWTETPAFERTRRDQPCSSAAWPAEGQRGQTVDLLLSYARASTRPDRGICALTVPAPGGRTSP